MAWLRHLCLFQGLLKDIILVPGADVARRACPPRVARSAFLDNRIPTVPGKLFTLSSKLQYAKFTLHRKCSALK